MDFRSVRLDELAAQVRSGSMSAREVVGHALSRIDALNIELNAFVAVDGDAALEAADAVDAKVSSGRDPGPLAGIPIGVKDLEDARGFVTSKGSAAFADKAPATEDSVLVQRLKAAGCVVVGKTNTPELGWKADTDNVIFGPTANPWNHEHSPGGSSGGSAAAIAAGLVPLATGSDGGGSIRIPSACCGLPGFKPSLGRVPSGGPVGPDWHHLSTKGPMAASVHNLLHALDVVVGPDPTDLRSLPRPEASWPATGVDPGVPRKVAWSPTLGFATPDKEVLAICERTVRVIESLGAEIVEIDTVFEEDPINDWLGMTLAYNARTLAPFVGTPVWERVDPLLKLQIEWALEHHSMIEVVRAEDACHRLNLRLVELFHDVRLLVCPVTAAAPPPRSLGGQGLVNGEPDYNWVRYTYGFNMTRSPAATVRAGLTSEGLPVGLQLVGPQHGDLVVLRSMAAIEQAVGFDALAPTGS